MYELELTPDKVIILKFDPKKISVDEFHSYMKEIKNAFPGRTICCLPEGIQMTLKEYDEMIDFLIKERNKYYRTISI